MSAHAARPISLSDKEKKEFDHVTLDDIHEWRDVSKLRRLERYMTQEGFPTTASATAMRIKALSAGADISDEQRRKQVEAESKASAQELMSWTHKIVSEEQELSLEPTLLSSGAPGIRKGMKIATDVASSSKITSTPLEGAKGDSSVGLNARSGREYYDKWEKVAEDELKKIESENKSDSTTDDPSTNSVSPDANPENTLRICKAAEGMAPVEKRRQAESERHKGNDYFRAHDYHAAIEAFTVAAELDPQSSAARANRAAAYLKLHMWSDAETDACEALRLDPGNLKAQLRRAQARCELGQMRPAREDALAVLAQVPDEPAMLALVEKADSALKQSSRRMKIEEIGAASSAVQSSQQEPVPAGDKASQVQSLPNEGSSHSGPAAPEMTTSSRPSPSKPAPSPVAEFMPMSSQPAVAAASAGMDMPGSICTISGRNSTSDSASRPNVGDQTSAGADAPTGGTTSGAPRRVPIIMASSDSDSDDGSVTDAGGSTACCGDGAAARPHTGTDIPAASPSSAVSQPPISAAAEEVRSSCDAAVGSGTGTASSKLSPMPTSDTVRIQVVEDDEESAAADDALLAAASAASDVAAGGSTASPAINSVKQDTAPGSVVASPVSPRAASTGNNASPAAAAPAEAVTPEPVKSPEAAAEELMEKGRAQFAAGSLNEAKDTFTAAGAAWPLLAAAYSNRAAVSTRLGAWSHVVEDCTVVLALANTELLKYKALCRRAKARAHLADHLGSLRDLKDAEYFVPDNEKKALQRDVNAANTIVMRVKQEQAQLARKRAAKKSQKPIRSTAYGKVTVEELDSDDEEDEADDDPLAEAGRAVRETITKASQATGDVHARAQEMMEKYKQDVANAAAAAKAAQRARACAPAPVKSAATQKKTQPKSVATDTARITPPTVAAETGSSRKAPAAASPGGVTEQGHRVMHVASTAGGMEAHARAEPAESSAASMSEAGHPPAATPEPLTEQGAPAPYGAPSGHPSSSGSDSSYVLVDAPAAGASKAAPAPEQAPPAARERLQAADAPSSSAAAPAASGPKKPQEGDQGKADIMRVKGIDAWKAGDVSRALGLWSQAAQVAPKDYRVHLNISQALLRMSRHADALAAANTALEALEAAPDAPTDLFAKAQYRRGVALQELQKLPEALAALEASHEAMPTPETFAAVAKLREQVPQKHPDGVAAANSTRMTAAEAERAPWGAVPISGTGPPAAQRDTRTSGESHGSYVHVPRLGSSGGGAAAEGFDGSSAAPAGAMRATMESVSATGSVHDDADVADGPAPTVVPASDLESAAGPHEDAALRRFKVPIQEPPASAGSSPAASRAAAPADEGSQRTTQATHSSAAATPAEGTGGEQASAAPRRIRPESPHDLAEQALRVRRAHDGTGGEKSAPAVLPLPPIPTTAHEFLQAIQGLRRVADTPGQAEVAVVAYVRSVPTEDYAKVIKSNLDGRIVAELAAALKATVARDKMWCKSCLLGLVEVERVKIVLVMLPAAQKKALVEVKSQLALTSEESANLACIC